MVDLIESASRLQSLLESRGFRFCFIGGIAVQWWGEPRLTRDIDVSLLVGFGGEEPYVDALLAAYSPRIPDARSFALRNRVLLLRTEAGIGIDISLAALPYEELAIARATDIELLPGIRLRLCSAEDLIAMKLFAGRPTDLRDARSIVVRQGEPGLDWPYVETCVGELAALTEDPSLTARLRTLRTTV